LNKNILANFIGKFWSILSNFLFIPLYIRYLGFESYSIISFTLVIASIMAIMDSGLTATLSREFARSDTHFNEKLKKYKTLETCYFLIVILLIITVYVSSDYISNKWLNLDTLTPDKVSDYIKIIGFGFGFQMIMRFYLGGLMGLEKQITANKLQVGWGVIRNALVVFVISTIPNLEVFFLWQTITTIFFTFIIKFVLEKKLKLNSFSDILPKIEKDVVKKIWRFALGMLLISLVAGLNLQLDKILISKFLSIEVLGSYTLAVSLSTALLMVVNPVSAAILPRFTNLYTKGRIVESSLLYSKINSYTSIILFAIMANLSFFSEQILFIWTGDLNIASNASIYLPIISLSYVMLSLAVFPYNIAIANGYTSLSNKLGLSSLFITLPGYFLATKYYGGIGAALVFAIVQTLITIIYIYVINNKFLKGISLTTIYFRQMLLPFLISIISTYGFYLISLSLFENRVIMLLYIFLSVSVSIIISLLLLKNKDFIHFLRHIYKIMCKKKI